MWRRGDEAGDENSKMEIVEFSCFRCVTTSFKNCLSVRLLVSKDFLNAKHQDLSCNVNTQQLTDNFFRRLPQKGKRAVSLKYMTNWLIGCWIDRLIYWLSIGLKHETQYPKDFLFFLVLFHTPIQLTRMEREAIDFNFYHRQFLMVTDHIHLWEETMSSH